MFKKGKNHGTIALSNPIFLLAIHHKETWLKPNPNPNLDNWTNDPIFHLLFELYPLVHFIFAFQDFQNSVP